MNRSHNNMFGAVRWCLLLPLLYALGLTGAPGASSSPNIVLFYVDDLGWTDTSVHMIKERADTRSDYYRTPNLERFAREGMIFSNAYAPAPVCTPSRSSMLYGMTPARLRNATLNTDAAKKKNLGVLSIPQALKQADSSYVTAHFGKWHMPYITPTGVGYDVTDGPTGNGEGDLDDNNQPLPEDDPKRMFSLTDRTEAFMEKQARAERPFFVQVSHYAVHVGHASLPATREKYRRLPRGKKCTDRDYEDPATFESEEIRCNWILNYAAMIDDLDRTFGDLLSKIEELGIGDNTYVFFTSDNGGGLRGNDPLRGAKADLTEGGIRVPMVVRGPGVLKDAYCDEPVVGWDLLPTFSDLAGATAALPDVLDGGSLRSVLEQGNDGSVARASDALVFHFPWYNMEPESAIRQGRYKLLKNLDTRSLSLFDLSRDPEEQNDLSRTMTDKVAELHDQLNGYLEEVNAEDVQALRKGYRKRVVEEWIPNWEEKVKTLRKEVEEGAEDRTAELAKAERHVKWLHGQVAFTDERSKLHE